MSELSHVDDQGRARMIDVSAKAVTRRVATAGGRLETNAEVIALVRADGLPKADVLATARIAGIAGAKRTSELIPLAHLLALDSVTVEFDLNESSIEIRSTVTVTAKTGVEMEALTAVAVAGLTLHDMIKAVDPRATLGEIRLLEKSGGKRGVWMRDADTDSGPEAVDARGTAVVIVSSTRAASGAAEDRTGPTIVEWLRARGYEIDSPIVCADADVTSALADAVADLAGADPHDRRHRRPSGRWHPGGHPRRSRPRVAGRRRSAAGGGTRRTFRRRPSVAPSPGWPAQPSSSTCPDQSAEYATASPCSTPFCGTCISRSPVATMTEHFARITESVVDREAVESFVLSTADGALVSFAGIIRDHDHGASVTGLEYSAHPDAEAFLAAICSDLASETGLRIAAVHRIGRLTVGDVALVAAVAAPHRADAFSACVRLVDLIKEGVPIWKRQHLTDGATEWVGL